MFASLLHSPEILTARLAPFASARYNTSSTSGASNPITVIEPLYFSFKSTASSRACSSGSLGLNRIMSSSSDFPSFPMVSSSITSGTILSNTKICIVLFSSVDYNCIAIFLFPELIHRCMYEYLQLTAYCPALNASRMHCTDHMRETPFLSYSIIHHPLCPYE